MNRSRFLLTSTSVAGLAACSSSSAMFERTSFGTPSGLGAPLSQPRFTRLEIGEFSKDAKLVADFRAGIKAMREISDPRNTRSYTYWHYSHWMPDSKPPKEMEPVWDQCKHKEAFFESWHRGFVYFFEKVLREASGNPLFALPYWDYYKDPNVPKIFSEPTLEGGEPNPLYWANRKRSTVEGLGFKAFADTVTVFPYADGTFEGLICLNPHDRVHSQIGGSLGSVRTAPSDPLFWVHHCNIDRYWSAWIAAGGDRHMPSQHDELFWKERFAYDLDGSWELDVLQMNDTHNLGYKYEDISLPTPPPGASLPALPAVAARGLENAAGPISLGLRPITVEIPLDARVTGANSVEVVLDGVQTTALGALGGYDFSLFANLPAVRTPIARASSFEIGEFGSFDLSMPRTSGMSMSPGGGSTLRFAAAAPGASLFLSFVAFGGQADADRDAELVRIARINVIPR
ncbi:MAG TPA: tyrosinase family protein [Candidatus Cybelea sp.]|nr:tyrosinase family protein [Candidatus Cybelea sp.]